MARRGAEPRRCPDACHQNYFCQVSANATGKVLLATYFSNRAPHPSLIGINPKTGTSSTLPIQGDYVIDGVEAAW